jgi:dihydroflavonol-4-reductase
MIGTAVAESAREKGWALRCLVRPSSDVSQLAALGAEMVSGDVSSRTDVKTAMQGADKVLHLAAVLAGREQDPHLHESVNYDGTVNVLDAANELGVARTVTATTYTYFDMTSGPLSEASLVDPNAGKDPYTQTKMRAFVEAESRATSGDEVCTVVIGCTYGASRLAERSMQAPSFNARLLWAMNGELDSFVRIPMPFVYVDDVASCILSALTKAEKGDRLLAFGHPDDVCSVAEFADLGCRLAGIDRHVEEISGTDLDLPKTLERFGPTLVALAKKKYAVPLFDNTLTVQKFGYKPRRLEDGVTTTVQWLVESGYVSTE